LVAAAIDWSGVGQFPSVATASPGGVSASPGLMIHSLHGAGASGRDIDRVRREGLPRRVEEKGVVPFIVVAPQSPRGGWDVETLDGLLDEIIGRYRVDVDRVYLTGESMGGHGAWAMAAAHLKRFAAIAPIRGGGDPASAGRLRGVPVWAFHGSDDRLVAL